MIAFLALSGWPKRIFIGIQTGFQRLDRIHADLSFRPAFRAVIAPGVPGKGGPVDQGGMPVDERTGLDPFQQASGKRKCAAKKAPFLSKLRRLILLPIRVYILVVKKSFSPSSRVASQVPDRQLPKTGIRKPLPRYPACSDATTLRADSSAPAIQAFQPGHMLTGKIHLPVRL